MNNRVSNRRAESVSIDVEDDVGDKKYRTFNRKVTVLERFILVANFFLEVPSAVFDQLSSVRKPHYALMSMLFSFIVLIFSTIDLVYKARKERVTFIWRGLMIPWFYYPNHKRFGTFTDINGLVCGIFQCFFTSIAYGFCSRHLDNPINVNAWPMIFALGVLYCRFSVSPPEGQPVPQNGESTPLIIRGPNKEGEFTLAELTAATKNFSAENEISAGSSIVVYRGKLGDGGEVAVKKRQKKFQEKEKALVAFLSRLQHIHLVRLHHKHLVRLIGYCDDRDYSLLVNEYMENGTLFDILHGTENNNVIKFLKMRIKIALDAARGIEHLHNHAVPQIVHGGINSSNIWLDANWTAKVSDFEFSLLDPESPTFITPLKDLQVKFSFDHEFYQRNLSTEDDVYSFGEVLLEILTGKRTLFKDYDHLTPSDLVDKVLDPRLGPLEDNRAAAELVAHRLGPMEDNRPAAELVAHTAIRCVNLEPKDRPSIIDIVANLEQALSFYDKDIVEDMDLLKDVDLLEISQIS
ncbi:putative serine/threonine-protein kinase-like protein CCR3 [Jatropha curcas]|uniref:putative serine/threonine-protein kinase-like protein CCR3 n=1 Tax=Jatropha curcas TaxID=180498 RepID=UPI001893B434|nr:putative serine/threonine-protein kinase-like protein CCR3 [Jatropha curcas]